MNRILIEKSPSPHKIDVLGAETWPLKRITAGRYTRSYTTSEECYIVAGTATLACEAQNTETVNGGDLVFIPRGLTVTWDIAKAVEYHWHECPNT